MDIPKNINKMSTEELKKNINNNDNILYLLKNIKNITPEVQLAAVQRYGNAIEYISHPSLEVQFAAVQENGYAIEYIKDPSPEVQLAAVQQNNESISYIFKPDITVKIYI